MPRILELFHPFTHSKKYIFYFSNVFCLPFFYYAHISGQFSLPNNHNHLFDKFSCSIPKHILLISLNTELTMLCSQNLWYLLNTHTLPSPSSLSLSNCSVRFLKASKVWSLPNIHPNPYSLPRWPTCRSWSNHSNLLCFQTHSESFCRCLCLSYSLVLEDPSSHYLPVKFNSYLTSLKVNNKTNTKTF